MDLQTYLRIFHKRWKAIVAVLLAVVLAVAAYTVLSPKKYDSSLQFFVSTSDSTDAAQLAQSSTFSQARVTSYTQLVTAPVVLQPVITQLHLKTSAKDLGKTVTATVPANTVLIDVDVTASSPKQAQRIASAIGKQFPTTVENLEKVSKKSDSPVKVTVTKMAIVNTTPVSPKPVRNLVLAVILGLLLGLGAAVLRHVLDAKVRTKEDVEGLEAELTVIGGIPFDSDASKHPLLVLSDPHSSRAEAFRTLRTNLRFVDASNHPRSIVMTSTLAGEGKTTTTANLALTLAEAGSTVCLIEGDLRRPKLLEYLGMEGAVGLTDVLIESADLTDVLQPFGKHKLAVIGAGQLPPNPSELLGSSGMEDVLHRLESRFDYVLIDAPPLLPVTDAAVLTTITGGAVLVVGSGLVTRDQLSTAVDSLEAVKGNLLGVALNRIPRSSRIGGYYDYRYEYRPQPGNATSRAGARALDEPKSKRFAVRR